jgi:hypothetical protein
MIITHQLILTAHDSAGEKSFGIEKGDEFIICIEKHTMIAVHINIVEDYGGEED